MTLAEKLKAKKAERDLWKSTPVTLKKKATHTVVQKQANKESAEGWAIYLMKRIEAEDKAMLEASRHSKPITCKITFKPDNTPDCVVDWSEIQIKSVAHNATFFYL